MRESAAPRGEFPLAKFLVTGGAGFIGSNIVTALVENGETVVVLDDFSSGKRRNLAGLEEKIEVIEGSIVNLDTCRQAVAGADYVLHQAAVASVPKSVEDPAMCNEVNVGGTLSILIAARDEGVKRLVYASSSSVYGDTEVLPTAESVAADPLSPYAVSKYTGELYARNFARLYGFETVMLRYFNVFGPRQDPQSEYAAVIPKFIVACMNGEAITIHGDGLQTRDFCHIANTVRCNLLACEAGADALGQAFNCACGVRTDLNELAAVIAELTGQDVEVRHGDARSDDIRHSYADIEKARRLLGYEPEVQLREGIQEVIAWYKEHG